MIVHLSDLALRCATNIQYQTANAFNMLNRMFWVDATLKTVSGIGRKIEPPRSSSDRLRPPKGSFDVNMLRVIRDRSGITTHNACKRLHL